MVRLLPNILQHIAVGAVLTSTPLTYAHDGHGLMGSHWHATDLWGFLAVGVLLAIAIWQGRK